MLQKLNPLQKAVWYGARDIPLNGVIIWRVCGVLSAGQLHGALNAVKKAEPIVAARLMEHPVEGPCLTTSGVPDFQIREQDADNEAWLDAAAQELDTPFELGQGPLLRLRLLRTGAHSDIIAVFHHAVYDGMSLLYLLKRIMAALEGRPEDIPRQDVLPDIADRLPEAARRSPRIRALLALAAVIAPLTRLWFDLRGRSGGSPTSAAREGADSAPGGRYRIAKSEWDVGPAADLIARCRREGVSVHSAVCTAFLRAAADTLPGREGRFRGFTSPVNLRPRLEPPLEEEMGPVLSRVEVQVACLPDRGFWETCREIQAKMRRFTAPERLFAPILLLPALLAPVPDGQMPHVVEHFLHRTVRRALAISNLGQLELPGASGPHPVAAVYLAGGVFADAMTLTILTLQGRMFFALTFREGALDRDSADRLLSRGLAELSAC